MNLVKIKKEADDVYKISLQLMVWHKKKYNNHKSKNFCKREKYIKVFIVERDDFEDFHIGLDIIEKFKMI